MDWIKYSVVKIKGLGNAIKRYSNDLDDVLHFGDLDCAQTKAGKAFLIQDLRTCFLFRFCFFFFEDVLVFDF